MPKRKNYPGHIRPRGEDRYQVILTLDGERHITTLEAVTEEEAQQWARDEFKRLKRLGGAGGAYLQMSDLLKAYEDAEVPKKAPNTRKSYLQALGVIRHFFVTMKGDPKVHTVTKDAVEAFVTWRQSHRRRKGNGWVPGEVSARTVQKDRTMLFMLFEWTEAVERNPVAKVEPPRRDPREPVLLSDAQYEELLKACDREARPMLWLYTLLLGETGLRCDSEALWLRWDALDMERGILTVEGARKGRRTKSGKARAVPLTPRLREALRDHAARYRLRTYHGQRTPWVFHHVVDRRKAKAGERITGLRRAFDKAVERAGLPSDLHQHDLRHRRVTTWLAAGKSPVLVQKAMGHSDLRVTLGYTHLVAEDLLQLVEPTPAKRGTGRAS